jgi:hypothetical protein
MIEGVIEMSFLELLRTLEAKNGDVFMDGKGREWVYNSDGSACQMVCTDGKTKLKFTEEQLNLCSSPSGFKVKKSERELLLGQIADTVKTLDSIKQELERVWHE